MASAERVQRLPGVVLGNDLTLEVDAVAAVYGNSLYPQKARPPSIAIRSICPSAGAHSTLSIGSVAANPCLHTPSLSSKVLSSKLMQPSTSPMA